MWRKALALGLVLMAIATAPWEAAVDAAVGGPAGIAFFAASTIAGWL